MRHLTHLALTGLFLLFHAHASLAQCSIGDPNNNNPTDWNAMQTIEANFNAARRWEETDRGLTANCLGNMTAPPGGWNSLSQEEIIFYIHNQERTARNLLPLHGVETNLSMVAQAHSDWQIVNDVFSHTGDPAFGTSDTYKICPLPGNMVNGSVLSQRINAKANLSGCWTSISENIYVQVSFVNVFSNFGARAMYAFLYRDGGSAWGHRHAILQAFVDNNGPTGNEGFIGIGIATGADYQAVDFTCDIWPYASILTIDYFDPSAACTNFMFSVQLPVELLAFEAETVPAGVQLDWSTAGEQNSAYFEVQRSSDGLHFESIGMVAAAGNSQDILAYSFLDKQPIPGLNYYRLKQVDLDGAYEILPVRAVDVSTFASLRVSPNPFRDQVKVQWQDETGSPAQVSILDVTGRIWYQTDQPVGDTWLDLSYLPAGVYFLRLQIGRNQQLKRLIKQ